MEVVEWKVKFEWKNRMEVKFEWKNRMVVKIRMENGRLQ